MSEGFRSCLCEHGIQIPDLAAFRRTGQNVVTCLYQTKLAGFSPYVSITWFKNLIGQGLTVSIDLPTAQFTCKMDIKPWLFWKKHGLKSFDIGGKLDVLWDLSSAKYLGSPEPREHFYVALVFNQEIVLLLGDMQNEALKKCCAIPAPIESALLSRKEHVFGRKFYSTKAQFGDSGRTHDIVIECHTGSEKDPRLYVRVDKHVVLRVKRLMWKFRGNQTIIVDGLPVEVFWDVHNWLFKPSDSHAVFMFQTSLSNEKPCSRDMGVPASSVLQWPATHSFKDTGNKQCLTESSCTSVLQWPSSLSFKEREPGHCGQGFSLLLYAWKNE